MKNDQQQEKIERSPDSIRASVDKSLLNILESISTASRTVRDEIEFLIRNYVTLYEKYEKLEKDFNDYKEKCEGKKVKP